MLHDRFVGLHNHENLGAVRGHKLAHVQVGVMAKFGHYCVAHQRQEVLRAVVNADPVVVVRVWGLHLHHKAALAQLLALVLVSGGVAEVAAEKFPLLFLREASGHYAADWLLDGQLDALGAKVFILV